MKALYGERLDADVLVGKQEERLPQQGFAGRRADGALELELTGVAAGGWAGLSGPSFGASSPIHAVARRATKRGVPKAQCSPIRSIWSVPGMQVWRKIGG